MSSFTVDPPNEEWILVGYSSGASAYSYVLLFYNDQTEQFMLRWQMVKPPISFTDQHSYKYHVALVIYRDLDKDGNLTDSDEIIGSRTGNQTGVGAGYQSGWISPFSASVGGDWTDIRWLAVGLVGWNVVVPEDSWWKEAFTWQGVVIGLIGIGIAIACIGTASLACVAIGIVVAAIGVALSFPGLADMQNEIKTYEYVEGVLGIQGPLSPGTVVSSSWLHGRNEGNDTLADDWQNAEPYDSGEYILHTTVQRFNKIAVKFSTPQHGSIIMSLAVNGLSNNMPYITTSRTSHEVIFEVELDITYMESSPNGWLWRIKHTPDGIPILEFDLIMLVDYEIYDYDHLFPDPGYPLLNQKFLAEWNAYGIDSQVISVNSNDEIVVSIDWSLLGVGFLIRDWALQILGSRPYYFIDLNSPDIVILSGEQPAFREEIVQQNLSTLSPSAMQQNPYSWTNETDVLGALIDPDGYVHRTIVSGALPTVTKRITVPDPNNTIVYAPELHDFVLHIEEGPVSPLASYYSIPTLNLLNETGIPASVILNITCLDDPLEVLPPMFGETSAIRLAQPESGSVIVPKQGNGSLRTLGSNRATEITLNETSALNNTLISILDPQTTAIIRMPNVTGPVTISMTNASWVRPSDPPSSIPYDLSMFIQIFSNETFVDLLNEAGAYFPLAYMNLTSITTYPIVPFGTVESSSSEKGSVFINHTSDPSHIIASIDLTHNSANDDEVVFFIPDTIGSRDRLPVAGWITRQYQAVEEVIVSSTWGSNSTWTLPHGLVLADFHLPDSIIPGDYIVTVHYVGNASDPSDDKNMSKQVTITSNPTISNVTIDPASPTSADSVSVYAEVVDDVAVDSVDLWWKTSTQQSWSQTPMSGPIGDTYEAVIDPQTDGTVVQFYVEAFDTTGNVTTSPFNPPVATYCYISADSDSTPPEFLEVARDPTRGSAVTELDAVQIFADIGDDDGIQITVLYWKTTTETQWNIVLMRLSLEDWYTTRFPIPELPRGSKVECVIKTNDYSNNTAEEICQQPFEYLVTIREDVNGDGVVELSDFFIAAAAFGSTPEDQNWDQRADVNSDEFVELSDFFAIAQHFGENYS